MSFALTTEQLLNGSKDVTRRLGWRTLKAGTRILGVRKAMGLRKGESPSPLAEIEVLAVTREPLYSIAARTDETRREGFPDLTGAQFVELFCRHMGCRADTEVTRIEFRIVRLANARPVQIGLLGGVL